MRCDGKHEGVRKTLISRLASGTSGLEKHRDRVASRGRESERQRRQTRQTRPKTRQKTRNSRSSPREKNTQTCRNEWQSQHQDSQALPREICAAKISIVSRPCLCTRYYSNSEAACRYQGPIRSLNTVVRDCEKPCI
jgi:uncharacterized membrane-anchored protein